MDIDQNHFAGQGRLPHLSRRVPRLEKALEKDAKTVTFCSTAKIANTRMNVGEFETSETEKTRTPCPPWIRLMFAFG
jgi:hypothetical protein